MTDTYPKKLGKDPLVEVVFEVRLGAGPSSLSAVFPGVLKAKFKEQIKGIRQLPTFNIPKPVRDAQEGLRYQPSVQVEKEKFLIGISDCSVVLVCKEPYVGWSKFKEEITEIVRILKENTNQRVERFSLKYINFLEDSLIERKLSSLNVQLNIAGRDINTEGNFIRVTNKEEQFLTIVTIASDVKVNTKSSNGIIIDLDVIRQIDISMDVLSEDIECNIDLLHEEAKKKFFSLLKDGTLEKLEPDYEQ